MIKQWTIHEVKSGRKKHNTIIIYNPSQVNQMMLDFRWLMMIMIFYLLELAFLNGNFRIHKIGGTYHL